MLHSISRSSFRNESLHAFVNPRRSPSASINRNETYKCRDLNAIFGFCEWFGWKLDLNVFLQKFSPGFWIKGLNGRFFKRVEYEGLSHLCFHCGIIGHKVESCPHIDKLQPDNDVDSTRQSTVMEMHNQDIPVHTQ
ncbi:hypothetical protein M5K25_001873 [Dendrobium thyrsiflorum]|uniref:CCHC-type domain-containing protein n=1 Tax=Dendrobium thyrsiflorum TaxID=117978 RepID=A0ABD0VRJ7_DENTH